MVFFCQNLESQHILILILKLNSYLTMGVILKYVIILDLDEIPALRLFLSFFKTVFILLPKP